MEAEEAQRRHELEMKHLELEQTKHWPRAQANNYEDRAKAPKLPSSVDGKDNLDAYCYDMQKTFRTSTFAFSFLCNSQLLCNFLDWLCNHFGLLTCQFSGYTSKHYNK